MASLSASLLLALVATVSATCYKPDGTAVDDSYQPCNGTVPVSMCCHLGFVNNNGDVCGSGASYGLCGVTGSQLWRESCTDPTWQSPYCLKLCVDGANDQMITACPDGSYCCGANNATCCTAGHGLFIVNNAVSNTSTTISSSPPPTATPTTTTPSPTAATGISTSPSQTTSPPGASTSTAAPSSSSGLSTPAIIGLSVGIAVAVIAAALLAGIFVWKRRQKAKQGATAQAEMDGAGREDEKKNRLRMMSELDAAQRRSELGPENMPVEADGSPWRAAAELPGSSGG